jgi:hypothetical protein
MRMQSSLNIQKKIKREGVLDAKIGKIPGQETV